MQLTLFEVVVVFLLTLQLAPDREDAAKKVYIIGHKIKYHFFNDVYIVVVNSKDISVIVKVIKKIMMMLIRRGHFCFCMACFS